MKELKLLLACSMFFGLSLGMTACDVEDDEEDCEVGPCGDTGAGGVGGMGGEGGVGGGEPVEYTYVIIVDNSAVENMAGTPGADICGMTLDCGADPIQPTTAVVEQGAGLVCDGTSMMAPCETGVDRSNPTAATDDGATCEPTSNPSDYVSLGVQGQLAARFDFDVTDCNITIEELAGRDNEPYDVYVCQTAVLDPDTCLTTDPIGSSPAAGGSASFDIPAAE